MLLSNDKFRDINYSDGILDTNGSSPGKQHFEAAIHMAVKKCHIECVSVLLDYSIHSQICDINARMHSGQSPLLIACDKGDVEIVRQLIQYEPMDCDLNARDSKGYTALMKAVGKGHRPVVELLLDLKQNPLGTPDLTVANQWGYCATMMAVRTGNYELAQLLLQHPDNEGVLFRKDWRGRGVLDLLKMQMKQSSDQHGKKKQATLYVRELLWRKVDVAIQETIEMKRVDLPHLPDSIVRCISTMMY